MTLVPCSQCGRPMEVASESAELMKKLIICGTCAKRTPLIASPYDFTIAKAWECGGVRVTPISRAHILVRCDTQNTDCEKCDHREVCKLKSGVEAMYSVCGQFKPATRRR